MSPLQILKRILIVDQDSSAIDTLVDILRNDYALSVCRDIQSAYDVYFTNEPDLVMLDVTLNSHTSLIRHITTGACGPVAPVIVMDERGNSSSRASWFNAGAGGYLIKPFVSEEVLATARLHLSAHSAIPHFGPSSLTETFMGRKEAVIHFGVASHFGGKEMDAHIRRVMGYTRILCESLGMPSEECELMHLAAALHDVGMLFVPPEICNNKTSLADAEQLRVQSHCALGGQLLSTADSKLGRMAKVVAMHHHENWDGTGYPLALSGEAIPLAGRIVRLCDSFDAMQSLRPHRKPLSTDLARQELKRLSGVAFDPLLVEVFLSRFDLLRGVGLRHPQGYA